MEQERRALRAFEAHLSEVMTVDEATAVVDRLDRTVSEAYLDQRLEQQTHRLAAMWRRDLLLIVGAQFFALAGAVGALVTLA